MEKTCTSSPNAGSSQPLARSFGCLGASGRRVSWDCKPAAGSESLLGSAEAACHDAIEPHSAVLDLAEQIRILQLEQRDSIPVQTSSCSARRCSASHAMMGLLEAGSCIYK